MRQTIGRHRRTRTLSIAAAVSVAAGAGGVYLGLAHDGAQAAASTVTVSSTASLEKAVANAVAGTTIQVRAGTYRPARTLKSTANGTPTARITLTAYRGEKVKVDGSALPAGSWLAAIHGDHWTVSGITFQNSPAQGLVVTSSVGGIFENLVTANNGDSGFTLRGDGTTDNLVRNLDSHGNYDAANHGQNADGIAVKFGSGTGNRITGARLYNNADDGLDLWQFSSPVTVDHSWAFGNGKNRWNDPAFEGNGNGFKLGGGGVSVAHLVNNNAAWDNTLHGFTENSNTGAILLNRNTAYANKESGFYFATGKARLARNLAVGNGAGKAKLGSRTVSAANNWDGGVATPAFRSTDAATASTARRTDGSLPVTTFLTTGSKAIGATMN
ncbi:right-handed parallel beta-helix repeat-containing protein [Streptomyces caniscabiei]|uniref:right-handed parallel beta-helix repeat-containing protein n=1 Tax=Streptomyces caniscabiei TaxID=2746961 RepID=UPI0029A2586A|nr:right-handed parallel beta-helix repeat-containing protein [Streptomyces caniscabiei]MDX2605253.1 right-handed parallel beta-helix repeat-containing protein [Streptomyces caniscabiei]MDX2738411.1 right-handed parallel beta-helix repeat-containing protein [Streptomyces caniscabiei]MDX2778307.1 right-handed parallel beta-helix repeat-containing protein [Streptomyces caniscabiei]